MIGSAGRYRAFEGAGGWYVSFERPDGTHGHVPEQAHYVDRALAEYVAGKRNAERDDAAYMARDHLESLISKP